VNIAVLWVETAGVERIVRGFGAKMAHSIFPAATFLSFAILALSPSFVAAVIARINHTGLRPAFRDPVATLFLSTLPVHARTRIHALANGLAVPAGLACAGLGLALLPRGEIVPAILLGVGVAAVFLLLMALERRAFH
jgi:hypothetical protein